MKGDALKLCLIEWIDAKSDCVWTDDIKKWEKDDCIVTDIGWIISESKNHITICSQFVNDGTWGNRTKVPKAWVRKTRVICDKRIKKPFSTNSKAQPRKSME